MMDDEDPGLITVEPCAGPFYEALQQAPPAPAVPPAVTNFQARAVLMQMPGAASDRSLFEEIDAALRTQGGVAWQAWEKANEFTRRGALVNTMAAQFGLTEEQLDALFIQAAGVEA